MLRMNLNAGGSFSVPHGFPVRLSAATDSRLEGVIPRTATTVTATLQTELGTASAHLALFTMPTTSGGQDLAPVAQADLVGMTTKAGQSIAVSVPAGAAPACYIARLWIDSITASSADAISRDGATAVAIEPRIPVGVLVQSVTVS